MRTHSLGLGVLLWASAACSGHRPPLAYPVLDRAFGTDITLLPTSVRLGQEPGSVSLKLRSPVYLTAVELSDRGDGFRVVNSSGGDAAHLFIAFADINVNAGTTVQRGRNIDRHGFVSTNGSQPDCRSLQQATDRADAFYNLDCESYVKWRFKRPLFIVATTATWQTMRGPTDWLATLAAPPVVAGQWVVIPISPRPATPTFVLRAP